MIGVKRTVLGISDLKNLFQFIKSRYSIDLFNYAISSFKKRLEDFMEHYHVSSFDELIHKFETDKDFFQLFFAFHLVDTTEMFRDPEFWAELKNIVHKKYNTNTEFKVLIPDCNSGEELYTFLIVNSEIEFSKKTKVCLTTICKENIDRILSGHQLVKKMETNVANFERYLEGKNLMEYFTTRSNFSAVKPELFENVELIHHNIISDNFQGVYDLILFRNKMLYFNPQLKIEVLRKLDSVLKPGGIIAVGVKESFDYPSWEQNYAFVSESERIYRKKGG